MKILQLIEYSLNREWIDLSTLHSNFLDRGRKVKPLSNSHNLPTYNYVTLPWLWPDRNPDVRKRQRWQDQHKHTRAVKIQCPICSTKLPVRPFPFLEHWCTSEPVPGWCHRQITKQNILQSLVPKQCVFESCQDWSWRKVKSCNQLRSLQQELLHEWSFVYTWITQSCYFGSWCRIRYLPLQHHDCPWWWRPERIQTWLEFGMCPSTSPLWCLPNNG